jgi:CheY-like chemotaxis protein
VLFARSGEEAVKSALQNSSDLILMDLHMPGMDKLEATRRIRGKLREKSPPIVALTADVISNTIEEAKRCGVVDYLSKPISSAMLEKCLRECL